MNAADSDTGGGLDTVEAAFEVGLETVVVVVVVVVVVDTEDEAIVVDVASVVVVAVGGFVGGHALP